MYSVGHIILYKIYASQKGQRRHNSDLPVIYSQLDDNPMGSYYSVCVLYDGVHCFLHVTSRNYVSLQKRKILYDIFASNGKIYKHAVIDRMLWQWLISMSIYVDTGDL